MTRNSPSSPRDGTALNRAIARPRGGEILAENQKASWAGTLLFCGGVAFALVNTIAESLYPGYNVRTDALSLLGAVNAPTHLLWNSAVIVLAVTWFLGAFLLFHRARQWLTLNLLPPLGVLLVGLFPIGTVERIHVWSALFVFSVSGIVILLDAHLMRGMFRYLSGALGAVSLICLVLSTLLPIGGRLLGYGGAERIIVYPIILWLVSLGVYLMAPHAPRTGIAFPVDPEIGS